MSGSSSNIGIVLVHGVGEQRRFEHLSGEMTQLVLALNRLGYTTSVEPNSSASSAYLAEHESWRADGVAPLRVDARNGSSTISIFVHEVWWADLDNKATLRNQIKFWFWGLGMWWVRRYRESNVPGTKKMLLPQLAARSAMLRQFVGRVRLFGFAVAFLLSLGTLNLLNYLLARLKLGQLPGGDILYQYVGDVKLYQDRKQEGQGAITDINGPRRVAIRRRMIATLIDVYNAPYDRWYVLGHSLGTVVAWNGLMETAHCLPNYLSKETWDSLVRKPNIVVPDPNAGRTDVMQPSRPVWITDDRLTINRQELFAKLRGFVTYGSPLDKFAFLWPQIVSINRDVNVWSAGFEWINVFDHTDPVAAKLTAFHGAMGRDVKNFAYKASPFLLYSHIRYLHESKRDDAFSVRLMEWILAGNTEFTEPAPQDSSWYRTQSFGFGFLVRAAMWIAGGFLMALAIACLLAPMLLALLKFIEGACSSHLCTSVLNAITQASTRFEQRPVGCRVASVVGVAAASVFLVGIVRRLVEQRMHAKALKNAASGGSPASGNAQAAGSK